MKDIKVLGIDLAKNVFQVHAVDAEGALPTLVTAEGARLCPVGSVTAARSHLAQAVSGLLLQCPRTLLTGHGDGGVK